MTVRLVRQTAWNKHFISGTHDVCTGSRAHFPTTFYPCPLSSISISCMQKFGSARISRHLLLASDPPQHRRTEPVSCAHTLCTALCLHPCNWQGTSLRCTHSHRQSTTFVFPILQGWWQKFAKHRIWQVQAVLRVLVTVLRVLSADAAATTYLEGTVSSLEQRRMSLRASQVLQRPPVQSHTIPWLQSNWLHSRTHPAPQSPYFKLPSM